MKVSREQAAQNRERILIVAAKLFRERGFDGIGVADLMKQAGLTHGGFYGHFAGKEDLMAKACELALQGSAKEWDRWAARDKDSPLAAITKGYLSNRHRDQPGRGCVVAALGADAVHQGAAVRAAMTKGVRALVDKLEKLLPQKSKAARRQKALAAFAGMVGTMVLARVVDDPLLSEEILQAFANSTPLLESSDG